METKVLETAYGNLLLESAQATFSAPDKAEPSISKVPFFIEITKQIWSYDAQQ